MSFDPATFVPECVYHYTSAVGFAGIATNGHVRATNFSFLNDPSEVTYGADLTRELLRTRRVLLPEEHKPIIDYILTSFDSEVVAEVYVACFTRLEDDLSQWRAYGSAAVERYAVGFDTEELDRLSTGPTSFVRIKYETAEQVDRTHGASPSRAERSGVQAGEGVAHHPVAFTRR